MEGVSQKLSNIPTCELVKELSSREGVERILTAPEGIDVIMSLNNLFMDDYKMQRKGPSIILRIID